jgi:uncharacterized membrane protein
MQLPKEAVLVVAIFAAVGSGMMAGLLFAFSNFVMTALSQQPAASAIRTMQAINVYILNPFFFVVFLGTAVASVALAVTAVLRLSNPGASLFLAGSLAYLVGAVGVTMVFNVPLNNRLEGQDPGAAEAAQYWLAYLTDWMKWNHVRTAASVLATVLLILAIRQLSNLTPPSD